MKNLTFRVDEETYKEIEETADRENMDKSTVARRLLKAGIEQARKRRAIKQYREGRWSLWRTNEPPKNKGKVKQIVKEANY